MKHVPWWGTQLGYISWGDTRQPGDVPDHLLPAPACSPSCSEQSQKGEGQQGQQDRERGVWGSIAMGVILGDDNVGVPLRGIEPHLDAATAATVVGCVAVGARPDLLAECSRRGEHKLELLAHGTLGTLVGAWEWARGEVSEGLWETGVVPLCMGCRWVPLALLGKRELTSRWHRVYPT